MKRLMCKRLAGVAVTALALTLAGCGGSSNTQNNGESTETPAAVTQAKGALTTAQNAVSDTPTAAEHQAIATAAGNVVTALRANDGSADDIATYTGIQNLNQAWANYLTAGSGVAALTDDSTDVQIRDAHQTRFTAAGALVAMLTDSDEIREVAQAEAESEAAVTAASGRITTAQNEAADTQRKADNAASMQVAMAILDHPGTSVAPPEFGMGSGDDAQAFGINRVSGDAKFKLGQTDAQAKDKPFKPEGGADAPTGAKWGEDWMGKTFTYTDPDGKKPMESGTVYTSIETAEERAWTSTDFGSLSTVAVGDAGLVTITGNPDAEHFTGNVLPPSPASSDEDTGTTRKIGENAKIAGTFYGVSGTFSCGTGCTLTRTPEGQVTVPDEATFTFAPTIPSGKTAGDLKAKYAKPDDEYLHFGYWMKSTKQKDGTYKHEIDTFSGVQGATATFGEIRGKAEYSGAAAGRYVKKSGFDAKGDPSEVSDGTFVADVSLTAQFGNDDGTVAVADQWSIKGEISNFMDGSDDLGWKLMLDKADLASGDPSRSETTGVADTPAAAFTGETTGSAGARGGAWSGTMYGNAGPASTADDATDDHPVGVAGQFNGHFTNGHVAGAFGAEKDD